MTNDKEQPTRKWIEEAEEALNRTAEALRAAWNESHDARSSALHSAKEATNRLGGAIDQGIAAAKKTWDPGKDATGATAKTSDEEE